MKTRWIGVTALLLLAGSTGCEAKSPTVVAAGARLEKLAGGFLFTEGPAADARGEVYFTDIPNNRIHKWSPSTRKLTTYREDSGGANGLFFDKKGNLFVCEGQRRRVVSIDPQGKVTVLAERYKNGRFNKPNDLWVDPKGGVYFSDPYYGREKPTLEQDGEHVYYISPDRKSVIRVADDLVRPNGLIGTADGKLLYIADHGGDKTFVYRVAADGTLSNKKLFVAKGSDGMTIDNRGNIYLTDPKNKAVLVFNPRGENIDKIAVPEGPSNVCFGGKDRQTLFITARTSLYSIRMNVTGI